MSDGETSIWTRSSYQEAVSNCTARYKMDQIYMQTSIRRYDTIVPGLLKKKKKEECQITNFFTSHGAHTNCAIVAMLYTHSIGNQL